MKKFYKKSILFWFVLLLLALANASIRETTYKPLLAPHIGVWAHQISSVTGILLFFGAIYFLLKRTKEPYAKKDLIRVSCLWIIMTIIFECFMNFFVRKLSVQQVLQTYYFWKGEAWIFVLLSLLISPLIVQKILKRD